MNACITIIISLLLDDLSRVKKLFGRILFLGIRLLLFFPHQTLIIVTINDIQWYDDDDI